MPKKKKTPSKTPEITITIENGAKLYKKDGILYRKDYLEKENGITKCCIIEEGTFNERSQLIDGKIFGKIVDEKFDIKSNETIDKENTVMIEKIYRMQIGEYSIPIHEEGAFNERSELTKGQRVFFTQQDTMVVYKLCGNKTDFSLCHKKGKYIFQTNAQIQAEEKVQTLPKVEAFSEGKITCINIEDLTIEFSLKIEKNKIISISLVEKNHTNSIDFPWIKRESSFNFATNKSFAICEDKKGIRHKFFLGKCRDCIQLKNSELGSNTINLLDAIDIINPTIEGLQQTLDALISNNVPTKRLMPSKKDTVKPQETIDERSIEDLAREIEGADFVKKALKERKEKMITSSSNSKVTEYSPESEVTEYSPEDEEDEENKKKEEENKKSSPPKQRTYKPRFSKRLTETVIPEIYKAPDHQIASSTEPETETALSSTTVSSSPELVPNSSPSLPKALNFYEKFEESFLTEVLHAVAFILKDDNQTDNHYNNSKRDYYYNLLFSITDSSRDNPISLDDLCAGLFLDPEQTTNLGDRIKNRSQQLYSEGITSFALERTVQMALQSSYNQAIKACMVFIVAIPVNSQQPLEEQGRNLGARV